MPIGRSVNAVSHSGTVGNTVIDLVEFGFSAANVAAADVVTISVTANALRFTYNTNKADPPTNSTGLRLPTNNYPLQVIEGRINAGNLQMIRDGSADATVTIVLETI